jgi:hypothetical protein
MFNETDIRTKISQLLTFKSPKISTLKNLKIQNQKNTFVLKHQK